MFTNIPLFQKTRLWHMRPFNGCHCQVPVTDGSPDVHRILEATAAKAGARTLEACMTSSIPQARNGEIYLIIGGDEEVFESVRPLLADLSKAMRFAGPASKGAEVKALVKMVMNINTAALAEGAWNRRYAAESAALAGPSGWINRQARKSPEIEFFAVSPGKIDVLHANPAIKKARDAAVISLDE